MLSLRQSEARLPRVVLVVFWIIVGISIWWWLSHPIENNRLSNSRQGILHIPKIEKVTSNLLFTGNISWSGRVDGAAQTSKNRYAFPFARLKEFDRSKYNAWITSLECPTSSKGTDATTAEQLPAINCDPAYLPEFTKWFNIVNLANERTDDMGPESFIGTRMALERHKTQHIGHFDPKSTEDTCEVVALPVEVEYDDATVGEDDLPVAICGNNFVDTAPSEEAINQVAKYAKRMPTIAMPHGGQDNSPEPDEATSKAFHQMIDQGADMVIGSHPQLAQPTEAYKGKLIAYSLGDFLSDEQNIEQKADSAAIKVDMSIAGDQTGGIEQWLSLSKTCKEYNDDCLEKADQMSLAKVEAKYQFDVVAVSDSGYQTHPAPDSQKEIEQQLDWNRTVQSLTQK